MEKLLKKTKLVKQILQEIPATRCSDGKLIIEYFKRIGVNPYMPFEALVANGHFKDIETVSRARRKVQEQFVDLRDSRYYELRREQEPEYIDYSLNVTKQKIDKFCKETDNGTNTCD